MAEARLSKSPISKATGPGKYSYKQNAPNDWTVLLFNYDIEGRTLKKEHRDFLQTRIVPLLKAGCGASIFGDTSTTGSVAFNNDLGLARAKDLLVNLRAWAGVSFAIGLLDSRGKAMALKITGRDNTEDETWRSVWMRVWDRGHPPPDLGNGTINPHINPDIALASPAIGSLSSALDIIGGVVNVVDLGLELAADYTAIAAAVTVGGVTFLGGFALAIVSTIIGMPVIWASTDAIAEFNGRVQGYADAMQDMAEQYQDPTLDRKPVRRWPAIAQPTPHIFRAIPITTSEQFWRKGQRKGCDEAYMDVLKLELNPVETDIPIGGRPRKIKVNGKLALRALWVSTGGNAGVKIVTQVNEALKKQGKPPFPTH